MYSATLRGPLALMRDVRCRMNSCLRSCGSCVHSSRLKSCLLPENGQHTEPIYALHVCIFKDHILRGDTKFHVTIS